MSDVAYKQLIVWNVANKMVHLIYDLTMKFPREEIYSLTSQLRRAALSVIANIIEGHGRYNKNEFRHFLSIALGSLSEVEYYLEFALRRKYITENEFLKVEDLRKRCGQLLWKLYKSQARTNLTG